MAQGKDILLLGLVGVGGYFLYEWWIGQQAPAAAQPTTAGTTPTMVQTQQPTSVTTPVTPPAQTPVTSSTAHLTFAPAPYVGRTTAVIRSPAVTVTTIPGTSSAAIQPIHRVPVNPLLQ